MHPSNGSLNSAIVLVSAQMLRVTPARAVSAVGASSPPPLPFTAALRSPSARATAAAASSLSSSAASPIGSWILIAGPRGARNQGARSWFEVGARGEGGGMGWDKKMISVEKSGFSFPFNPPPPPEEEKKGKEEALNKS